MKSVSTQGCSVQVGVLVKFLMTGWGEMQLTELSSMPGCVLCFHLTPQVFLFPKDFSGGVIK